MPFDTKYKPEDVVVRPTWVAIPIKSFDFLITYNWMLSLTSAGIENSLEDGEFVIFENANDVREFLQEFGTINFNGQVTMKGS